MGKVLRFPQKRWKWPGLIVSGLAIYLIYSFAHLGLSLYQTNLQIKACQDQKAALMAEGNRLREQIKELNNNSYIERIAREELGLVKPGETVIVPAVPGQVRPYIPPRPGHQFRD